MTISFFCDFDGTITLDDVGDAMFRKFGNFETYWNEFENGKYNVRELNRKLCMSIDNYINFNDIIEFAKTQEVDAYFQKFVEYCNKNCHQLTIVSDGFDAYIMPILKQLQLSNIPVFCNKLLKSKVDMYFYPFFYGADESCNCTTASCKRNIVLNNSADDEIIVYIGDGMTDFCAAEHCDVIFAKSRLAAYCNEKKIPHHPFKSFFDIIRITDELIKNRKIKSRNQAFLKRQFAFESE